MSPDAILYVSSVTGLGGAEQSLVELARHLDGDRYRPHLLTTADGPLAHEFAALGAPVSVAEFPFFSRRRPWRYGAAVWRIVRAIQSARISLVHVNCDRAVPHAVLAGRITRTPVLCHIHDMTRAWFLPQYVRPLNRSQRIIADSQATARHCMRSGMDPRKLQVIYECVQLGRYTGTTDLLRQHVRSDWKFSADEVVVGLVGQVLRHKGHEEFIRAAAILAAECPEARFVVVGDDRLSGDRDFMPSLVQLVGSLGLEDVVRFIGYRSDVPAVMAGLDIVAVPSWEEPFGRVVVEALASARPVVATAAGGIPEIVEHGRTGLLVPPRNPAALATALVALCRKPDLRATLGACGPQAAQRFDVVAHSQLFARTYDAILMDRTRDLPLVPFGEPTWISKSAQSRVTT